MERFHRRPLASALLLMACVLGASRAVVRAGEDPADPPAGSTAAGTAARRWFQDARFGLFVHWGVYSLLGQGEWVMNNDKIPIAEYEKLPPRFDPTRFDADEWVKIAREAGARYITITSKHHDGF